MFVIYGHAELLISYSASLKDKRKIILSIISKVNKRFNVSISEVAFHDLWQRSMLGFASVCNTYSEAELMVSAIQDVIDQHEDACELIDFDYEINKYPLIS